VSQSSCTVLIAAPDLLPTLKQRTSGGGHEILTFTDTEALRALEAITKRRPAVVTLEQLFAATPRGKALINRIKADPSLTASEIRVVSHDTDYQKVTSGGPLADGGGGTATAGAATLDPRGTRRAPRFRVASGVEVLVDGTGAQLVDVSAVGAQVLTSATLRPNQRVRMALADEQGALRFNAAVAWASFEMPAGNGPRYRAGIDFLDVDTAAVEAYCARHKA